jgi:hypothetical protein
MGPSRSVLVLAVAALALAACGPAVPVAKTVSLRMVGTPPDARVTIDDQIVGPLSVVAAHGVALPPGAHRVTVEAPGYFPSDQVVEAKPGQGPIQLQITLLAVPE